MTADPRDDIQAPSAHPIVELDDERMTVCHRGLRLFAQPVVDGGTTAEPRWRVSDELGMIVGAVAAEREWLGHTYGPRTYAAVHNPGLRPGRARWRAEGFATAPDALEGLAARLSELRAESLDDSG